MRRSMRLAAIAVGVLGLVATTAPQPAQANTVGGAVYVAQITVGTGLGYPVLTLTTQTQIPPLTGSVLQLIAHMFDGEHPASNCLTLRNDFGEDPLCLTNSHWTFDHVRPLSVNAIVCADVLVNILKGKPPVHAPGCTFNTTPTTTLPNTVSGHCGLSSGQLTVRYVDGLGNVYLLDLHFKAFGSIVVITGHWYRGSQHGLIVSIAQALPPTSTVPVDPIGAAGQSCTTKTARDFLVVGAAAFASDPRLP